MKSLYRRYRPLTLGEVVGQPQVTEPLIAAIKAGKISHAYLFIGPRGCGKTSVARILAHEVNGFPYEIEDDYVDIIEIDGASNRGIDNIRELREKVAIAPSQGKYKIYIIDEVHMLTKEAFNALLKTLEEPPERVIFIMATTDAYKVPVTITSRAQTYIFHLADQTVMFDFLKSVCEKEGIQISDDALKVVAKRGGGSFRDSLSLLDQISTLSDKEITKDIVVRAMGLPEDEQITELLNTYANGDATETAKVLKGLLSAGVKAETLVEEMIAAIIDNPAAEWMPLLAKLPEVKSPFAEAKLVVALCYNNTGQPSSAFARPVAPRTATQSPVVNPPTKPAQPKTTLTFTPSQETETAALNETFDWNNFLEKVRRMNDAVYSQVANAGYVASAGTLRIYPEKKIARTILSRDNNKKILIDAAGGMRVEIGDPSENPNRKKDELISKISDIMGGEVQNDGGGNPF